MTQHQVANAITHKDLGTRERGGLMASLSFKAVLL